MNQQDIIDGLKVICICRGIRKKTFLRKIDLGKSSLTDLQKATGAGSGSCGGKRCTPKILELLRLKDKG